MINLKITMNSGKEFNINNPIVDNVKEWIKRVLMPQGVQLHWVEIIPGSGSYIQVDQIQEIREISENEVNELHKPSIVEQETLPVPDGPEGTETVENEGSD